ncbi:hypothetical protein E2C01_049185 [Portunus trituberculatus]|uniref:Uncharacterized protein n=1 Tax=Portunus trituberculatus TaxID=210409 RepID=A0A5B7GD93_PORTR|nr:hypothetical protein [Portunus trituberculatus]
MEDFEGSLVGLLEGLSDAADSEEDVGTAVKVLAGKGLGRGRKDNGDTHVHVYLCLEMGHFK